MKLYQLLQSFDFEELFPTVSTMFPNANLHRDVFQKAFDMLCSIQPVMSKKTIRYELMEDPNSSNSMIVEPTTVVSTPLGMPAWARK